MRRWRQVLAVLLAGVVLAMAMPVGAAGLKKRPTEGGSCSGQLETWQITYPTGLYSTVGIRLATASLMGAVRSRCGMIESADFFSLAVDPILGVAVDDSGVAVAIDNARNFVEYTVWTRFTLLVRGLPISELVTKGVRCYSGRHNNCEVIQ